LEVAEQGVPGPGGEGEDRSLRILGVPYGDEPDDFGYLDALHGGLASGALPPEGTCDLDALFQLAVAPAASLPDADLKVCHVHRSDVTRRMMSREAISESAAAEA